MCTCWNLISVSDTENIQLSANQVSAIPIIGDSDYRRRFSDPRICLQASYYVLTYTYLIIGASNYRWIFSDPRR